MEQKMEQYMHRCGHQADVPSNMGRGQARQKRIIEHFSSSCPPCQTESLKKLAASLHRIIGKDEATGKFITRPYNHEEQAAYLAKHGIIS